MESENLRKMFAKIEMFLNKNEDITINIKKDDDNIIQVETIILNKF